MSKQEMTMEREGKILQDTVDVFGAERQMNMAIEEMSELTKAICKYKRAEDEAARELATMSIREEAADEHGNRGNERADESDLQVQTGRR